MFFISLYRIVLLFNFVFFLSLGDKIKLLINDCTMHICTSYIQSDRKFENDEFLRILKNHF